MRAHVCFNAIFKRENKNIKEPGSYKTIMNSLAGKSLYARSSLKGGRNIP